MYADVQRGRRRGAEFEQKYYMVNEHTIRACKVIFLGDSEVYKAHWVTVIAFNTVRNSCLLAFGKIDKREFISRCEKDIVVTAFLLVVEPLAQQPQQLCLLLRWQWSAAPTLITSNQTTKESKITLKRRIKN